MENELNVKRETVIRIVLCAGIGLLIYGGFMAGEYFGVKAAVEQDQKYIADMCYCMNRTSYKPEYELQVNLSFLETEKKK